MLRCTYIRSLVCLNRTYYMRNPTWLELPVMYCQGMTPLPCRHGLEMELGPRSTANPPCLQFCLVDEELLRLPASISVLVPRSFAVSVVWQCGVSSQQTCVGLSQWLSVKCRTMRGALRLYWLVLEVMIFLVFWLSGTDDAEDRKG
jgi:hypothetical protein